jgi:hypothetical protein
MPLVMYSSAQVRATIKQDKTEILHSILPIGIQTIIESEMEIRK